MNDRILSLLGLCTKAGRVVSGEFMTEKAVKTCEALLVIVAGDASDNTKKEFNDMCAYRNIPIFEYSTKENLARAMGKEERASLAVLDEGFANRLIQLLSDL